MRHVFSYEQIVFILDLLNEKNYKIGQIYDSFVKAHHYDKKIGAFRIDLKEKFPEIYCKADSKYYHHYYYPHAWSNKQKDHINIEYPEHIKVSIQEKNAAMMKSIEQQFCPTIETNNQTAEADTLSHADSSDKLLEIENPPSTNDHSTFYSNTPLQNLDSEKISHGKEKCLQILKQDIPTATNELLNHTSANSTEDPLSERADNIKGLMFKINKIEDRLNNYIKSNNEDIKKIHEFMNKVNEKNADNIQILDALIDTLTKIRKNMEHSD